MIGNSTRIFFVILSRLHRNHRQTPVEHDIYVRMIRRSAQTCESSPATRVGIEGSSTLTPQVVADVLSCGMKIKTELAVLLGSLPWTRNERYVERFFTSLETNEVNAENDTEDEPFNEEKDEGVVKRGCSKRRKRPSSNWGHFIDIEDVSEETHLSTKEEEDVDQLAESVSEKIALKETRKYIEEQCETYRDEEEFSTFKSSCSERRRSKRHRSEEYLGCALKERGDGGIFYRSRRPCSRAKSTSCCVSEDIRSIVACGDSQNKMPGLLSQKTSMSELKVEAKIPSTLLT